MSDAPEPSEMAKTTMQGCSFLLWIGAAFLVLIVLGAIVRGCTQSSEPPLPASLPVDEVGDVEEVVALSEATFLCIDHRITIWTDYTLEEVYAMDDTHPVRRRVAHLSHGCMTDAEADYWRPEAVWPPSYQRCVEAEVGVGAFVDMAMDEAFDWDDIPDAMTTCIPKPTPSPTPAMGVGS